MYFPLLLIASILRPVTPAAKAGGDGCLTIAGKRRTQLTIARPTTRGRRAALDAAPSGRSGNDRRQPGLVAPVGPDPRLHLDAGQKLVGVGHDPRHDLAEPVLLGVRHLEHELVVDLEQHAPGQAGLLELLAPPPHG